MISNHIKKEIKTHAIREIPHECCGVIVSKNDELSAFPCRNSAETKECNFILDYRDYYKASLAGEIKYLYHSQPSVFPSDLDKQVCKGHNIPSVIYSWNDDMFSYLNPDDKIDINKYIGREYGIGKNDCFGMVRDYYKEELNIELTNFQRNREELRENPDLITNNWKNEGFIKLKKTDNINMHDIIVFKFGDVFRHHLGIYLGNNLFLRQWHKLSDIEILKYEYKSRIDFVIRHKSLF